VLRRVRTVFAFFLVGCVVDDPRGDAGEGTQGGSDELGSETDEGGDGDGDPDPCGTPDCPQLNPCQGVTCCGPNDPGCNPIFHDTQVVFAWSQFSSDCTTGCHGAAVPAAGLSLLAENDPWCSLVDRPSSGSSPLNLVEPGEPLQSYLWHKLNGTHQCAGVDGEGSAMPPPPNACPLAVQDEATFDLITQWICCGAPKDPDDPLGQGCF
jgi:hypothetical protein